MSTNPENHSSEIESNALATITRRSFIKRTSSTILLTAIALNNFRTEARADETDSSSVEKPKWTLKATGFGSPMITRLPEIGNHPLGEVSELKTDGTDRPEWLKPTNYDLLDYHDSVLDGDPESPFYLLSVHCPCITACYSRVKSGPYFETELHAGTGDWDFYQTSFQFDWEIQVFVSLNPWGGFTGPGQTAGGAALQSVKFDYHGDISIDTESGVVTPHADPEHPVADGFARTPHTKAGVPYSAKYRATVYGGPSHEADWISQNRSMEPCRDDFGWSRSLE